MGGGVIDPIIRKVKDSVVEWASKSWPLAAHLEFDAENGKPIRRQTIDTPAGREVVGIAQMLEPEHFAPVVLDGARLPADEPKRMREMFNIELEEED